jgi:hypothetical protein
LALGRIGPSAKAAVPALVTALKDASGDHDGAASAIGHIGVDAASAIPVLIEVLKRERSDRAAFALGEIGVADKIAIDALIDALNDPSATLLQQEAAAFSLGRMGPSASEALPALRAAKGRGLSNASDSIDRVEGSGTGTTTHSRSN